MIDPPPPAELAFLTEAIGAEATLALIEARAGTRVYVQLDAIKTSGPTIGGRPARFLAQLIGRTASAALVRAFGGCYIDVPAAKHWRAHVYRARGMSCAEIALKLGLDERTVQRYLAGSLGTRRRQGATPRRRADLKPSKQTELQI